MTIHCLRAYEPAGLFSKAISLAWSLNERLKLLQQAVLDWHIRCQQSTAKKYVSLGSLGPEARSIRILMYPPPLPRYT